ncbi:hypothetical protein [Legionella drancourtii]|uniref:Uncharacterized protein n=1 Tax=Legionella drancourtii LLAP12 TaxID=658187 RepID=G9EM31_9GAMM|nr:hypothetical protein [Legionella drancourtii]EHL31631.1 hypothetical protein LDG_6293 [Legionella drancourtii LLAP12]
MNLLFKSLSAIALSLSAVTTFASPAYLTTYNNTSEESNAYVAGVPSIYPTPANSKRDVYWNLVKLACYGHTTGRNCLAVVKMATNTANPIEIGTLSMNLDTGDITPKQLSNNGYTVTVTGIAETTITKN